MKVAQPCRTRETTNKLLKTITTMKKKIVVDHGDQQKIAAAMGCTREMVSKSLNYAKDTALARKIRYVAVKQYGGAIAEIGTAR